MLPSTALRVGCVLLTTLQVLSCTGSSNSSLRSGTNRIHEGAVVIDAHAHPKSNEAEALILGERTGAIEVDFITMEEGGLDAVFFSAPLLRGRSGSPETPEQVLEDIGSIVEEVRRHGDLAEVARSPGDILRIHRLGKRAVLLGMETPDPFGGDLGTLRRYFDAGVRMITLSPEGLMARDPGRGDPADLPSNDFMTRVVEEMNRLGMIIDITHAPDGLQMEIIRTSAGPVIASHSNARALNDVPRQVPDSIIQALAAKGGVICVTFFPGHISADFPDQPVTIEDLVDHIDHIVRVAGVDHVGLGSDFAGGETHTVGLESAAGLPGITSVLLERGYSSGEIEKILGGNLLRVFETVQEAERNENDASGV